MESECLEDLPDEKILLKRSLRNSLMKMLKWSIKHV